MDWLTNSAGSVLRLSYCTGRPGDILESYKDDCHVPKCDHTPPTRHAVNELLIWEKRLFSTLNGKEVLMNQDRRKSKLTEFLFLLIKNIAEWLFEDFLFLIVCI